MNTAPWLAIAGYEEDESLGGWHGVTDASGRLLGVEYVLFTCFWWLVIIAEIHLGISEI